MGRRREVVSVRLTADELRSVSAAASAEHDTVSGFLRGRVLRAALAAEPGARVTTLPNGAPLVYVVNAPAGVAFTGS
jgi:hypothetical protein